MKKSALAATVMVLAVAFFGSSGARLNAKSPESGWDAFLDDLAARVASYSELNNWRAAVRSSVTEMDKNWRPIKTTVVRKIVTVAEGRSHEEILEVLETEKGVTRDIREQYVRDAEERRRQAEERRRRRNRGDDSSEGHLEFGRDDFAPFSREKRQNYKFSLHPDGTVDGRPVRIVSTEALVKDREVFEGRYHIDKETLDILRVELRPAKNPRFVKHLEMDIFFQPGIGSLALKGSRMKIHAGFILKTMRLVVEEEYTDFEILDSSGL